MRPSKLRLPDSTEAAIRSLVVDGLGDRRVGSGPELPMQVVQPIADEVEAELVEVLLQAGLQIFVTTWLPGASEVFTQGLRSGPARGLAGHQAGADQHDGFEVLVQEVIAAMATSPWPIVVVLAFDR
jgi:hypothetical protein